MAEPAARGSLKEAICIGLFAAYDDLSISVARSNWRAGFAYGAVGSDGYQDVVQTADRIMDALAEHKG